MSLNDLQNVPFVLSNCFTIYYRLVYNFHSKIRGF